MKLSQLQKTSFNSVRLPTKNLCLTKSKKLMAEENTFDELEIDPDFITKTVINDSGNQLSPRERRSLPYYILETRFDNFNPKFCETVLNNFSSKKSFWSKLFRAWMFHYDMELNQGALVRNKLRRNRSLLTDRCIKIDDAFNVLSDRPDRNRLSCQILDKEISKESLSDISFNNGVIGGRFSGSVLIGIAKYCMKNALTEEQLEVLTQLICPLDTIHESVKGIALVSLIFALKDRKNHSEKYLRAKEVVEANYKDPRMYFHTWPEVPEELGGQHTLQICSNIVKKWHVYQSILLFFKLIGEVVEDEAHDHQFPLRESFWLDYFKQDRVSEAWVILGSRGDAAAKKYQVSGNSDFAALSWANLSGAKSDQCALLIKIGDVTIVEWSHSGACRLWKSDDSHAPKFAQMKYDGSDLRNIVSDSNYDRIVHDAYGNWQQKIRQRINSYSGFRSFF